jgi:hypothetical protein
MSEAPQPINFGGVGDVDMYPAETNDSMIGIAEAGKVVGDAWAAAAPALLADEAKVGGGLDDLSTNFRKQYAVLKPQLEKAVGEAPANFEAMGANGNQIVLQYMELTHQQIDRLRRL